MIGGIFIILIFAIIPIAIISLIISAIVKRTKSNSSEEEQTAYFENIIRSIYVYLLLICLLCAIIGGTIYLFSSAVDYIIPEKSYSSYYNYTAIERNESIVGIFTSSAILISTVPLFIYHSKIAKNELLKKKSNIDK